MDCLVLVLISLCWDFKDYIDKLLEKCVNLWCVVLFNVFFWKVVYIYIELIGEIFVFIL